MIYRFGRFALDTDSFALTADGEVIAVEPQVFSLLQFLIENRERVVIKDEIINEVWDGRIVSDGTLNSRVNSARRAVGDDGKAQSVIKTFPRRGFRFVAELIDGEVESAADSLSAAPLTEKPSIAVLPFQNLSGDPEQEYFSDGMSEDIIMALSRLLWFRVVSRYSSFSYKGQSPDIRTVAEELGARYVLEGSVRKASNRVRITAQLIDGETGSSIWSETYDRDLEDIFTLQDEITRMVVSGIEPELMSAEWKRSWSKPTENMAAWDYYQRGMAHVWSGERHGEADRIIAAKEMFLKAIELDPEFVDAYAGLGICGFFNLVLGLAEDSRATQDEALAHVQYGASLEENNPLVHLAAGMVYSTRREFDAAIHHFEKCLALNPSSSHAHSNIAQPYTLSGRGEEALKHADTAIRMSPRSPHIGPYHVRRAEALFQLKRYEEAAEATREALRSPATQIWGNVYLIASLSLLGRETDVRRAVNDLHLRRNDITLKFVRDYFDGVDPELVGRLVEALQNAGLPEG